MAFNLGRAGDRLLIQQGISAIPKAFVSGSYAASWASASTNAPAVGDLVKIDTSIDSGVKQCEASDVPAGLVWSVNSSNGTLTVVRLDKTISVVLENSNTPTRGHSVQATGHIGTIKVNGVLRDQVKDTGSFTAGSGTITDIITAGNPGLIVVSWPALVSTAI